LAQAEGRHGLAEFAEGEGLPLSTARRWARVARAFPPSERRVHGVTFSHFEAVAGSPARKRLVELAAREGWSAGRLRTEAAFTTAAERQASSCQRSFGPSTLDDADRYLGWLARDGGSGERQPDPSMRQRVDRLAQAATNLITAWADGA
jgi:hypothetical protein